MADNSKPVVGIFDFTCCNGCEMTIINCEDDLLDLVGALDIRNFRLARGTNSPALKPGMFREKGTFDVSLIEGTVITEEEIKWAKEIRENSRFVISLGTCSAVGGLPAMIRNKRMYPDQEAVRKIQHPADNIVVQKRTEPKALKEVIPIDFEIRGCPIDKQEVLNVLKQLLIGKMPEVFAKSVCLECKVKHNPCIYTDTKEWLKCSFPRIDADPKDLIKYEPDLCMGPITQGGCNALCTSLGRGCQGCRGPAEDANLKAFIDILKEKGMEKDEIHRIITKFGGHIKAMEEFKWN